MSIAILVYTLLDENGEQNAYLAKVVLSNFMLYTDLEGGFSGSAEQCHHWVKQ